MAGSRKCDIRVGKTNKFFKMAKISNTRWQMVYGYEDVITLQEEDWLKEAGGEAAYKYLNFPPYRSPLWIDAPVDSQGKLNFHKDSRIKGGWQSEPWKMVDFTYFRTTVKLTNLEDVNSFKVIINKVDDGARMYLFNNRPECKNGMHIPNEDGKFYGKSVTADFTPYVSEGLNTVVIVQFDHNPTLNTLTGGIDIEINGVPITTDPLLEVPKEDGIKWKFYWADNIRKDPANSLQALGEVNGTPFTYKSTEEVMTESQLQKHEKFPKLDDVSPIPNVNNIRNESVTENHLCFTKPVDNPIIVFASIGQGKTNLKVPIEFDCEIEILWQENVTKTGNIITGEEGYAIIKVPGLQIEKITFRYTVAETYANFFFGYAE